MIKKLAEFTKKSSFLNVSNDKLFEMIKRRAYENYCKRGYSHGRDMEDWYIAERQVKKELGLNK